MIEHHRLRRVDFVLRDERLGVSSKISRPRAISELTMMPLYQYDDHEPPITILVESTGPRSKYAISSGEQGRSSRRLKCRPDTSPAPLRPAGIGMSDPLCATQFSSGSLRGGQLVVALEVHLPVDNREDCVRAPLRLIGRAALRLSAAAPLIREQDLCSVVVERRRMPVREIRIGRGSNANGIRRIANIEQQTVASARATGQTNSRIHRYVVTLGRTRTGPRARCIADHLRNDTLNLRAQLGAVSGRRGATAVARFHDFVEMIA